VPIPPKYKCIRKFLEVLYVYGKILGAGHLGLGPEKTGPIRCGVPNFIFLKGNALEVLLVAPQIPVPTPSA
jgi:hypothetical protein